MFLPVSEEEPRCDACVQQLRVRLGQQDQLKTLLAAVPTTEKCLLHFISPRRPWRKVVQKRTDRKSNQFYVTTFLKTSALQELDLKRI